MPIPNVVTTLLDSVDAVLDGFIEATHGMFITNYGTTLNLVFVLAVAIYGLGIVTGRITEPLRQSMWNVFVWSIVYVLVTELDTFVTVIQTVVVDGVDELAGNLLGAISPKTGEGHSTTQGVYSALGDVFNIVLTIIKRIFAKGGWGKAMLWYVWGVVYFAVSALVVVLALYRIVTAKVALTVFLGLTWFILPLYLFKGTSFIVDGWRRQVLNYALTPIMVAAVLAVTLGALELVGMNELAEGKQQIGMWSVGFQVVFMGVAAGLFTQIGSMTAAVTGGSTLAANEIWRAIRDASSAPGQSVRNAASAARARSIRTANAFRG